VLTRAALVLSICLATTGHVSAQANRVVRLTTADDVGIYAAFYPPQTNPAPAVLLLHSLGKSRDEWALLAPLLQQVGFAVLAIDFRGHGESTRRVTARGLQSVDFNSFTSRDYAALLLDVNVAFDWLADQPGVDARRIGIAGSSLGANLALRYAVVNDEIAALLLLSPGLVYHEIRTDDVIGKTGSRPLRIVVSRDDPFAFESAKRLVELRNAGGPSTRSNELTVCTGFLHGAAMLTGVKDLTGVVVAWLRQALAQ